MATAFKTIVKADPNTIMIVDGLNIAFRWKHSGAKEFVDDYISLIESLKKSYKAGKVIIACDEGSSSYRKELLPEYKQNRKDKQATQTPEEEAAFEAFFKEFLKAIQTIEDVGEYPVLRFNKCEADDIAAYIVTKYAKTKRIWLISSDKDWDLLIGPNVSRFSYVTRKEVTYDNWGDHYDYPCDAHISIKCLTGDSGDNIPGVKGIGPKKAQNLVSAYGTTYDIIASLPISSRYKHIANLNEFGADSLMRNYRLMDLISYCDEALGMDNCETIDNILKVYL